LKRCTARSTMTCRLGITSGSLRCIKGQPAAPTAVIGATHPLRQKRRHAQPAGALSNVSLREGSAENLYQSRPFDELSADGRWRRLGGKQYRWFASFCDAGRRVVIGLIRW
jgi:hypothetical protein